MATSAPGSIGVFTSGPRGYALAAPFSALNMQLLLGEIHQIPPGKCVGREVFMTLNQEIYFA